MNQSANDYRQVKWITFSSALCAILGWGFFNASKHLPYLAQVGVFIEDPYDAVGSFGILLAGFTCLLAILRLFRPRRADDFSFAASASILRCNLVALTAALVTLSADTLALLRYHLKWTDVSAGWILAGLTLGLLALAAFIFARNLNLGLMIYSNQLRHPAWVIPYCLASALLLFFYPENWRAGSIGGLVAALTGMVVLFVLSAVITHYSFPHPPEPAEDLLDDLAAIYNKVQSNTRFLTGVFRGIDRLVHIAWVKKLLHYFNPRRHPWLIIVCGAVSVGLILFLVEVLGEGAPEASKFALALGAYVGIGSAGVIAGYAMFRNYLDLFRSE